MLGSIRHALTKSAAIIVVAAAVVSPLSAQQTRGNAPPELHALIEGVVAMLGSTGDSTLTVFAEKKLAPEYREEFTEHELLTHLQFLRVVAESSDGTMAARGAPGSVVLTLDEAGTVNIRVNWNDKFLITKLEEATD